PSAHARAARHGRLLRGAHGEAFVIGIRRARPTDAAAIAAVHVAAWRSTYPGILPDRYLAHLSVIRQASHYDRAIRAEGGVFVAAAWGDDLPPGGRPHVVGFTTTGLARSPGLAEAEIQTLYVLDDWRERGLGIERPDLAIDAALAHAAGNQLRELAAEIEDQDPFGGGILGHLVRSSHGGPGSSTAGYGRQAADP
ncbi:MAG: hypothetical protein ACREFN_01625, partial [Acetobacteraceae bacterium]